MGAVEPQMVVYANAKILEQYQKLMSDLLEQIERQNRAIEQQTEAAALGAGFIRSGNVYIKQSKLVSSAVGMVEAYQWFDGKAALDGFLSSMGDGYGGALLRDSSGEMVEKSRDDIMSDLPAFLETADTVQVESFFSVQKLILQKAFEKIMGTGTAAERKNSKDKDVIGELAWWIGKPAGSSEFVSQVEQAAPHLGAEEQKKLGMDGSITAIDGFKYLADPGFGELGSGGNRPSSIYLGFYNKLDLVSRYVDGKDSERMERIAGSIDPISATINQFNPVVMLANSIQNVRIASEVYGKDAGYMWEAQLLSAVKTPLRVVGSMLVAAGTAVMAAAGWTGIGALIGGAVALGGAVVSATANSIHVDAKSGKRSYQMTDEGALATLTDVVGGALGGYATYAARASNTAAAAVQAADTTAKLVAASEKAVAAAVTAQTAQSVALGSSAAMGILQAGAEFDSRGRFTGQWSLEGSRGDSALIGAGITFVAAGTAGAAGLKQGTLASDLTKSGVSTGMNMMLQYQKMISGHKNSYAGMAESDLSDLGSALGTVMQSQSQDWQNRLANALDRTHRASDSAAGLGVFARRDDEGNMRLDGAAQPAASAWGRFWKEGMSTLAGYGVLLGAVGSGIGAMAGAIGTGLGMAWNGLVDGSEWIGNKMLGRARWLGGKFMEGTETAALTHGNIRAPDGAASEAIGNWFGEKYDAVKQAVSDWWNEADEKNQMAERNEEVKKIAEEFQKLPAEKKVQYFLSILNQYEHAEKRGGTWVMQKTTGGFLGFGGTCERLEFDVDSGVLNVIHQDASGWEGFFGTRDYYINGVEITDGDVFFRGTDLRLQVIRQSEIKEYLQANPDKQHLFTQNGVGTDVLTALDLNDAQRKVYADKIANSRNYGGAIGVFNNTVGSGFLGDALNLFGSYGAQFGNAVLKKVFDMDPVFSGTEKAYDTWTEIIKSGNLENGGLIVAHSQGAQIVTQALQDDYSRNKKQYNAVLTLLGGAHTVKPADAVKHIYDVRNSPDLLTGLLNWMGDRINGRPDHNYTLIKEQDFIGWEEYDIDGYPMERAAYRKNWELPTSSVFGLYHTWADSYMPAMNYMKKQNKSNDWGLQ